MESGISNPMCVKDKGNYERFLQPYAQFTTHDEPSQAKSSDFKSLENSHLGMFSKIFLKDKQLITYYKIN